MLLIHVSRIGKSNYCLSSFCAWAKTGIWLPSCNDYLFVNKIHTPTSVMSEVHLGSGSTCPPKQEGKLRLYSMKFCPFSQRVRLILAAKGVDHEVVNINLKNKPEWLTDIHAEGKVPALDVGDKVVVESLDIADFLNDRYPDPPLYPSNSELKEKDKELIQKFGKVIAGTTRAIYNKDNLPLEEYMKDILEPLEEFEAELANRGTLFFGGDNPGMVDYMMWPWSERSKVPSALQDQDFQFPKDKFPKLMAWREAMKEDKAVKATYLDVDTHVKFLKRYFGPNPEFDNL